MRLGTYLQQIGLTDSEFATRLGVSRTTVLRWRTSKVMPSRAAQRRIFEATQGKVSPNDLTIAELHIADPVAANPRRARA